MAFNGLSIHDNGFFEGAKESVHELVELISPRETPLLDLLGQSTVFARNVKHDWLEDTLMPRTLVTSAVYDDTVTALDVHGGTGNLVAERLPVGTQLLNPVTGEYLVVTATTATQVTVTRGDGASSAATIADAQALEVLAEASLEGSEVTNDLGIGRVRLENFLQVFKRDLIVSDTLQNVSHYGVDDEFEHQKMKKMRDILIDLERAVTTGQTSGNTIGSDSARRRMNGMRSLLATNAASVGTITIDTVEDVIQSAWNNGGTNLNLLLVAQDVKRVVDSFTTERVREPFVGASARGRVRLFHSTYGDLEVVHTRWLPDGEFMVLDTDRVDVVPLQGDTFHFEEVARVGRARRGMITGQYTLELRGESTMAKARIGGF